MKEVLYAQLMDELSNRYGEVMGGAVLSKALGFASVSAMKQAIRRGALSLPTFFIHGRRGRFALTSDVVMWLTECRTNEDGRGSNGKPINLKKSVD